MQELGLGAATLTPSRNNGFLNMLEAARKRVRMLTTALPTFPSLLISADGLVPQVSRRRLCLSLLSPQTAVESKHACSTTPVSTHAAPQTLVLDYPFSPCGRSTRMYRWPAPAELQRTRAA